MVNELLRLVLLAELHEDLVPTPVAERLFGSQTVAEFEETFPDLSVQDGFIGKGDRMRAMKRRAISAEKLDRAHALVNEIAGIPWLLFVGVTGSVAFGNAREDDDIDLFVVTGDRRVWVTRLVEQIRYRSKGVRRTYGMKDVADKICINHYVSEKSLDLRPIPSRRFDVAVELAMMRPLLGGSFYRRIIEENSWVYDQFPNLHIEKTYTNSAQRNRPGSLIVDAVDLAAMALQYGYMRVMRHPWEKVRISRDSIQFYDVHRWKGRDKKLKELRERYDL